MIHWSGNGIAVPLVFGGCIAASQYACHYFFDVPLNPKGFGWPMLVGIGVASPIVWFMGRMSNREHEPEQIVDPQNPDHIQITTPPPTGDHHFMGLAMEYWGIIVPVIAGIVTTVIMFR